MSVTSVSRSVQARLDEAMGHMNAAGMLERKLDPTVGHSATLLNTLAFEILLKTVFLATRSKLKGSHNYREIWLELPQEVRRSILISACDRFVGHADYMKLGTLLKDWRKTFEKARYSYEANDSRSDDALEKASSNWDEPDFNFHPIELQGLNESMLNWLRKWVDRLEQRQKQVGNDQLPGSGS
ncbi:hypothetical protein [Aestuariicoccus sp. MJ-SS9]|uniref:hypothetical protein n=1 Tax=Aestuariicoccus sp. MJ-SS9 TaxID=3079855 RepID=UPI0029095A58|nr:hypothetical protein [Aestuariicoccus sp. MJ-SS9]MDU8913182.1 hypothetical protein [Aestuariicoccus sp. MJ-SS9]